MTPDPARAAIRPAGPKDAAVLWPMVQALHRHERLPEPGPEVRKALDRLLADPSEGQAHVASDGARPVGYVVLTFGYSLEFHGRFGLVDELFVAEAERGKGLGARLLDEAERACRAEGIQALRLEVEHTNLDAERLYARRGFGRHDRRLMTKRLG
jgi:GNAT superfamily N-acetyltransferase